MFAFLGLRLTDVFQLAIAVPTGLHHSSRPAVDAVLMVAYLLESATISVVVIRARRFTSSLWATVDVTLALVVLLSEGVYTHPADRVGTWTAWGYAITIGAAFGAGVGYPRRWQTGSAAVMLGVAYFAVSLSAAASRGLEGTVWSNTLAYAGFALLPRALASFLRRLGREADRSRADASHAARAAERDRQRRLLHDHETVMRLLAQPVLDPALAELLRRQAASGANRVRRFLNDPHRAIDDPTNAAADTVRLVQTVRLALEDFGDLPIEQSLELAANVELSTAAAAALSGALETLLHNVRRHAHASAIVIHADQRPDGWEIVVRDDGIGFDTDNIRHGFGLREQVLANLSRHDVDTVLTSAPGLGTAVTLRGNTRDITS